MQKKKKKDLLANTTKSHPIWLLIAKYDNPHASQKTKKKKKFKMPKSDRKVYQMQRPHVIKQKKGDKQKMKNENEQTKSQRCN